MHLFYGVGISRTSLFFTKRSFGSNRRASDCGKTMLANKEGSSSADPPPKHRLFLPANSTARAVISQEVLQQRAADCHRRGDAFAGNITDGRIRQASGVLDNILILTILPILAPK